MAVPEGQGLMKNSTYWRSMCALAGVSLVVLSMPASADLVLETETARLGKEGTGAIGNAIQFEKDGEGTTILTLTAFEYAWSDRVELLLEPFFYEKQFPKVGDNVSGIGDTEFTISYLASEETEDVPAIVFAAKVKIPTGDAPDIGTGKADYTAYLILGKKIGNVDFNANLAFETFGQPSTGEDLHDQIIFDLSAEYPVAPRWTLYAEVFGDRIPANVNEGTVAGAIGAEYAINEHVNAFLSVGNDTDDLKTGRFGVNYTW